jgi:hypothetical protein
LGTPTPGLTPTPTPTPITLGTPTPGLTPTPTPTPITLGTPTPGLTPTPTPIDYGQAVCQFRLAKSAGTIRFKRQLDRLELHLGFKAPLQLPVTNGDKLTIEGSVRGVTLFATTTQSPFLQKSGSNFVYNEPGAARGLTHIDIDSAGTAVQTLNLVANEDLSALLPTQPVPVPIVFNLSIGTTTGFFPGDLVQNPANPETTLDLKLPINCFPSSER